MEDRPDVQPDNLLDDYRARRPPEQPIDNLHYGIRS